MLHVVRLGLKYRTQVTASYVSPAIQELHVAAAAAGICIMNEVGVDPGMCHWSRLLQPIMEAFPVCRESFLQSITKLWRSSHCLAGIDHMTALRLIKGLQARGGKITRFISLCGGLPAPEAADNPIGYKFSWSPIGVLRAATNVSQIRPCSLLHL